MMRLLQAALLSTVFAACVPMGGTYGTAYTTTTTRAVVVINGVELTPAQEDELANLLGERLPAGRYYVTDAGMMGIEGQPARVNLVEVIRARQSQQQVASSTGGGHAIHNSSGDSHITSDGHGCTILSTPTGTLASGC